MLAADQEVHFSIIGLLKESICEYNLSMPKQSKYYKSVRLYHLNICKKNEVILSKRLCTIFFFFLNCSVCLAKKELVSHWKESGHLMQVNELSVSPGQIVMSLLLRLSSGWLGFTPCLYCIFHGQTLTCHLVRDPIS